MRIGDVHRGGGRSPGQRALVMPKGAGHAKGRWSWKKERPHESGVLCGIIC